MKWLPAASLNLLIGLCAAVSVAVAAIEFSTPRNSSRETAHDHVSLARPQDVYPHMAVDLKEAFVKQTATPTIALIEFADFECAFCGRHARETLALVRRHFVETGKIAYAFYDFPLPRHRLAFQASQAAGCAGFQNSYWPMHDRLFLHQDRLTEAALLDHAIALGLSTGAFRSCLSTGSAARVRRHMEIGRRLGVRSTPTFFIGRLERSNMVRITKRFSGAQPYASFKSVLESALLEFRGQ